jgi:hypothetical protein
MAILNRLYPHLLPEDIELWQDWLKLHPTRFERFEYDVLIGQGRDPGPSYQPNIRQMAITLSQRRIDALGYNAEGITIIELTVSAGLRAIGQLATYPALFHATYNPRTAVSLLLICREVQSDIKPILEMNGVEYEILPKQA